MIALNYSVFSTRKRFYGWCKAYLLPHWQTVIVMPTMNCSSLFVVVVVVEAINIVITTLSSPSSPLGRSLYHSFKGLIF